jgi:hypothetical protein
MRPAGNLAEVGECCAGWRFKSKSNYALQRLGNSIGGAIGAKARNSSLTKVPDGRRR